MAKRGTMIQQSRRKSPAEKAAYHQITGAGKSRTLRQFFGISPRDEDAIIARIDTYLDRQIKKTP